MPERLTWANAGGFLYLSVIGAMLAYAVWFRGIARLPALMVSVLSLATLLCATLLGYLFLHQSLRPLQLVGAAALVAAVVLAQPRAPRPSPVTGAPMGVRGEAASCRDGEGNG